MEQSVKTMRSYKKADPSNWLTLILLVLVIAVLAFQMRQWFGSPGNPHSDATPRVVTPRGDLAEDEKTTIELFERVSPSVVYITSIAIQREAFSFRALAVPQGTGSGFIWDDRGYIVTNLHVISGSEEQMVTLSDQSTWQARVVGYEADKDLAVLKIDAPRDSLRTIAVGTSDNLLVGQKVFAIGNPFGLDHTLTTGVISGLGREIQAANLRPIQGVIQTDASINPGNSGGPLLDSAGRLIGINTAIYSPSGASAGVGFAVPVDVVNRMVPQIIQYGRVRKPGLGIAMVPESLVRRLGVEGVLVAEISEGGAAHKAGIRPTMRDRRGSIVLGDLIVGLNENPIRSCADLFRALDNQKIGDTVTLQIQRQNRKLELEVTLQQLNE